MKTPIAALCAEWAPLLAASHPDDLLPNQQAALEAHVASCPACAAARADYLAMDGLIRRLPAPTPLPGLPPALLQHWRREDERQVTALGSQIRDDGAPTSVPAAGSRISTAARPHVTAARAIAAVLLVGVLVGSYFALFAHHGPGGGTGYPGAPTATPDYGPTVLPTGPQPRVSDWQLVPFPPGTPDRAAQIAGVRGGAQVVAQPAVPGLLYACQLPLSDGGSARFWRSEDSGRAWTQLAVPQGTGGCYMVVSPRDPDTIFLDGVNPDAVYSLDRGDHWTLLTPPPGAASWDVGSPVADHGTWYFQIWLYYEDQPAIWTSSDHGAHWTQHSYPVQLPKRNPDGTWPVYEASLLLSYTRGGILVPHQHTLWWSPDDGAHWQVLGGWGDPPCDSIIVGTPDLSLLYCVLWSGMQQPHPYWRSTDRGLTWKPVPPGPPATLHRDSVVSNFATDLPMVLRDGTLLKLAPIPGHATTAAFYSLAPTANVWQQASAALAEPVAPCQYMSTVRPQPECADPLSLYVTAGINGTHVIYAQHGGSIGDIVNPVYVAAITWT